MFQLPHQSQHVTQRMKRSEWTPCVLRNDLCRTKPQPPRWNSDELMNALDLDDADEVSRILELGADPFLADEKGWCAMVAALVSHNSYLVKMFLMNKGLDVKTETDEIFFLAVTIATNDEVKSCPLSEPFEQMAENDRKACFNAAIEAFGQSQYDFLESHELFRAILSLRVDLVRFVIETISQFTEISHIKEQLMTCDENVFFFQLVQFAPQMEMALGIYDSRGKQWTEFESYCTLDVARAAYACLYPGKECQTEFEKSKFSATLHATNAILRTLFPDDLIALILDYKHILIVVRTSPYIDVETSLFFLLEDDLTPKTIPEFGLRFTAVKLESEAIKDDSQRGCVGIRSKTRVRPPRIPLCFQEYQEFIVKPNERDVEGVGDRTIRGLLLYWEWFEAEKHYYDVSYYSD